MNKGVQISKTIAGVKITGAIIVSVFIAGFGMHKYVEAQKDDTTAQTIEAIKPYFEATTGKLDKVLLEQTFSKQRDTLLLNDFKRYKIQNAKNDKQIIKIQQDFLNQLPLFMFREPTPDTLKKNYCYNYQLNI